MLARLQVKTWLLFNLTTAFTNGLFIFAGRGDPKLATSLAVLNGIPSGAQFLTDSILAGARDTPAHTSTRTHAHAHAYTRPCRCHRLRRILDWAAVRGSLHHIPGLHSKDCVRSRAGDSTGACSAAPRRTHDPSPRAADRAWLVPSTHTQAVLAAVGFVEPIGGRIQPQTDTVRNYISVVFFVVPFLLSIASFLIKRRCVVAESRAGAGPVADPG